MIYVGESRGRCQCFVCRSPCRTLPSDPDPPKHNRPVGTFPTTLEGVIPITIINLGVGNNQINSLKMNLRITIAIAATLWLSLCKAQNTDSIEARADYGSTIDDIQLLMELDKIDLYKVHFKNVHSQNGYFLITSKEYWNGIETISDTLLSADYAKKYFTVDKNDTAATFTLITKPLNDSIIFNYRYSGLRVTRKYKRINRDDYSLRDGIITGEEFRKIPVNQTIPLFVYSLPYENPEQPGYKFYCALTADGVPPEKWWDKYKVEHYIVVSIKIVAD